MTEQNLNKNQPSESGKYGDPNPGLYQGQGAIAAGDVGGVSDPGAGVLGNIPNANYGSTDGPNAVNPTGTASGLLSPIQARQFIDYVWDGTVLAKDGRKITMRANTIEIEKVNVGERVIRKASQALGEYTNAGATFTKVELTTTKIRLDWELSTESLEDNIEGAGLEDHLVRLMTSAFANDIEDLAINATGSGDPFLGIFPSGFVNEVTTSGDAHEAVVSVSDNAWTPAVMQSIIYALPRKYRAVKKNLKFYAGTDTFAGIVANNGTLSDAIAEALGVTGNTYANTQRYLDGIGQTFGDANTTRVLGIPVLEVPYYPADYVDLTFPANRVWGIQREIKMSREYKIKKDTIEYTVYVRMGIAWEELDAVAWADANSSDS